VAHYYLFLLLISFQGLCPSALDSTTLTLFTPYSVAFVKRTRWAAYDVFFAWRDVIVIRNIASGGSSGGDTLKWMREAFYKKVRCARSRLSSHRPSTMFIQSFIVFDSLLRCRSLTSASQVENTFNEIERQRAPKTIARTVRPTCVINTSSIFCCDARNFQISQDFAQFFCFAQMNVSTPRSKLSEGQSAFD
jgi:hypothetical protein